MNRNPYADSSEDDLEAQLRSLRPAGKLDTAALWQTHQHQLARASQRRRLWRRTLPAHVATAGLSAAATVLIMISGLAPEPSRSTATAPSSGPSAGAPAMPSSARRDGADVNVEAASRERRLVRSDRWSLNDWLDSAPPLQSPRGFEPAAPSAPQPGGDALLQSPPTLGQLTRELQIRGWDVML